MSRLVRFSTKSDLFSNRGKKQRLRVDFFIQSFFFLLKLIIILVLTFAKDSSTREMKTK